MNKKIELRDVSYVYGERTPFEITALKNVNLNIEAGSVTGIIGHTGSGKSTLISDVLFPAISNQVMRSKHPVGAYKNSDFIDETTGFIAQQNLKFNTNNEMTVGAEYYKTEVENAISTANTYTEEYVNTNLNEIKYVSYKEGVFGLYNDIDKVKARRIIERIKQLTDNLTLISENKRK